MSQRSRSWRRRGTFAVGALLFVAIGGLVAVRLLAGSVAPPLIGTSAGELQPCPDTDNCVQTMTATDTRHAAEPVTCPDGDTAEVVALLERDLPRTEVVATVGSYAHLEVRSEVFGFVDDLELLVEDDVVELRSASRIGGDDLGVNRERVERVRGILTGSPACG